MEQLICAKCRRTPDNIDEYIDAVAGTDMSPVQYVWEEEGTLDRRTGYFLCTLCYLSVGMPSNRYPAPNWTATPDNLRAVGVDA